MNPFSIVAGLFKSGLDAYNTNKKIKAAVDERKDELKKIKLSSDLERIAKGELSDIEQDDKTRGFAGWMDDLSFVLFLLPVPLAFFPDVVPHITAGFTALEAMPVAYQVIIALMLASVWGYKRVVTPIVLAFTKTWAKRLG